MPLELTCQACETALCNTKGVTKRKKAMGKSKRQGKKPGRSRRANRRSR